jgi:hypothetical protein
MNYTAIELQKLKTIKVDSFGDLKIENSFYRVWLAKDGVNFHNEITVEKLIKGSWVVLHVYPG